MTDKSATEAASSAEASETAGTPTNTERLRSHLKPQSLAAALLSAWEAGDQTSAQARLLAAFQEFKAEATE